VQTGPGRALLSGLLILEAVYSALWIQRLLPSLAVRDRTTLLLIGLRAVVSSLQLVGGVFVRMQRLTGPPLAQAAVIGSAALIPLEIGLRLVPTASDPTFRWWFVGGYWVYAAGMIMSLRRSGSSINHM